MSNDENQRLGIVDQWILADATERNTIPKTTYNTFYRGHSVQVSRVGIEIAPRLIETAWDFIVDGMESVEVYADKVGAYTAARKHIDEL